MSRSTLTPKVALMLSVPPLLWAGNAVVGRLAAHSVPPAALNLGRWLLAALILWPLGRAALRDRAAIARRWRYLALCGLLGVGSYNTLQYLALHTSSALNVTLITASAPLFSLAVGAALYRVRPRRVELLGAALSLLGVLTVISHGDPARIAALHFVPGDLLMLLAVVAWTFYSWLLARPPASMQGAQRPPWNWAEFLLLQVLMGIGFSTLTAAAEFTLDGGGWQWSPWVLALLAYVAIGPSVLAYRYWGQGVAVAGPSVAAFFVNLTPVFAAVLSAALVGEAPEWFHGLAFVLIVGGIVVSSARRA